MTDRHTRTWTEIGTPLIGRRLEDGHLTRPLVEQAIEMLRWLDAEQDMDLPMIPGLGIQAAIKELRIPKVSQVAISHELAPYGLYGIEGNYKNGRAHVYVVDVGSELIPIASDFWPAVLVSETTTQE